MIIIVTQVSSLDRDILLMQRREVLSRTGVFTG